MDYQQFDRLFGLIGFPLSHSFSKKYFAEKFASEAIPGAFYELFPLENILEFNDLIQRFPNLQGLNVTIPYKQQVIPYLSKLDKTAAKIGAVNTIKIENGQLVGYNTDVYGFGTALKQAMEKHELNIKRALVLGNGGAAQAVAFQLKEMKIEVQLVSRRLNDNSINYEDLEEEIIRQHQLIVNTTPLGMSPNIETCPNIPYAALSPKHLLYDLVYNPAETLFMKKGKEKGAQVLNGLQMLVLQAEKSWEIWND
jgi:shikimate dehydrogenase